MFCIDSLMAIPFTYMMHAVCIHFNHDFITDYLICKEIARFNKIKLRWSRSVIELHK